MTDHKTVDFYFDIGSLNAYLAHKVIPDIEARTGASFVYRPVLLGGVFKATGNQSPFQSFGHVEPKMAYEMLEIERFVARHKISAYTFNPHFPVNTLGAMRAIVAAGMMDCAPDVTEVLFAAMWEEKKKLDDPAILEETLRQAGIDTASLLVLTQDPKVKGALIDATDEAVARGIFGAPTYFVGDEMYFGKDRLGQVEEALTRL